MEAVVIGLIRVAGSLPVLRWAFVGGLIAVFTDLSDLFWREWLDLGGISNYQGWDKWLDQVYMGLFLVVALRSWTGWERRVAAWLFVYRLVGFAAFEAGLGDREILLFFPNVFEFWFLFVASRRHWPRRLTGGVGGGGGGGGGAGVDGAGGAGLAGVLGGAEGRAGIHAARGAVAGPVRGVRVHGDAVAVLAGPRGCAA